jgi:hypothetical protein
LRIVPLRVQTGRTLMECDPSGDSGLKTQVATARTTCRRTSLTSGLSPDVVK